MSWKWKAIFFASGWVVAAVLFTTGIAKADSYCGPGMNYDWRHQICQPGNPVPPGGNGVGVFPGPVFGQGGPGGSGLPSYGGN